MTSDITLYKRMFHKSLEPFKVMLAGKRNEMNEQEWLAFVERTKESVIRHPDEYLGQELPPTNTLRLIVQDIFDEVIKRML